MAYTSVSRSATIRVDGTVDSSADYPFVPSGAAFIDLSNGGILRKNALGEIDDVFSAKSAVSSEKLAAALNEWNILGSNNMGVNMGTQQLTSNQVRANAFTLTNRTRITDLAAYVTAGATATAKLRLCIFSTNLVTGLPATLLGASPDLAVATNNAQYTALFANFILEPGIYWAGFHSDTALTVRSLPWQNLECVRGFTSPANTTQVSRVEATLAFATVPTTFPGSPVQVTGSGQNVPAMFRKSVLAI